MLAVLLGVVDPVAPPPVATEGNNVIVVIISAITTLVFTGTGLVIAFTKLRSQKQQHQLDMQKIQDTSSANRREDRASVKADMVAMIEMWRTSAEAAWTRIAGLEEGTEERDGTIQELRQELLEAKRRELANLHRIEVLEEEERADKQRICDLEASVAQCREAISRFQQQGGQS